MVTIRLPSRHFALGSEKLFTSQLLARVFLISPTPDFGVSVLFLKLHTVTAVTPKKFNDLQGYNK
jgi:hypothetical protein